MPQQVTQIEFLGFTGGVNKSAPRDQMRPSQSPDMENFTVIDGIATKRTGGLPDTGTMASPGTGAFLGGSLYANSVETGVSVQTTIAFVDGGGGADTITDIAGSGFTVANGFADGGQITVNGSTSNDGTYTVVTRTNTQTLTLATGTLTEESAGATVTVLPAPTERMWIATKGKVWHKGSAAFDAAWTEATTANILQSGLDQYAVFAQNIGASDLKNYLFFSQNHTNYLTALNGNDPGSSDEMVIQYTNSPNGNMSALTGALGYNAADQSDDANFHRAKFVMTLGGSLVLLNTYEKTAADIWRALPYRIRISNENAFLASGDWETTGTSIATVRDARFGMGSIVGVTAVRSGLAIWLERGIAMLLQTDASFAPFTLQMRVPGLGLYSPKLIQTVRGRAYFVGTDKQIYVYWGGPDPEPIGQKIQPFFFDNINKAASGDYLIRRRSTSIHLQDIQAIAFIIPEDVTNNTDTSPYTWWLYFYLTDKWERFTMSGDVHSTTASAEWAQAAGIAAENLPLIGDHSGNVYHWDYANLTDAGTAISAYITTTTVDLGAKFRNQSPHLWFEASGEGTTPIVLVSASNDNGASFGTAIPETIRTGWGDAYKVPITIQGTKLSWRFANAESAVKLKLGRVWIGLANQGEID